MSNTGVISKEDMIVVASNFVRDLDNKTDDEKASLTVEFYKFLMRDEVIEKLLNTENKFKQVTISKAKELFHLKNRLELHNILKSYLYKVADKNKSQ